MVLFCLDFGLVFRDRVFLCSPVLELTDPVLNSEMLGLKVCATTLLFKNLYLCVCVNAPGEDPLGLKF